MGEDPTKQQQCLPFLFLHLDECLHGHRPPSLTTRTPILTLEGSPSGCPPKMGLHGSLSPEATAIASHTLGPSGFSWGQLLQRLPTPVWEIIMHAHTKL